MASLPATIQASRKRLVAETLLTLPSQWRKYQRNFDQRVAFEMGEYYRQWSRGCRYITRPEKVHINQACESADEIYTEQIIRQLSKYHIEVCKWKVGKKSMLSTGSHELHPSKKLPLARIEGLQPVFQHEHPTESKTPSRDALVESLTQSPFTFKLERQESHYSPPGMDKGVYLSGRAVPGQIVAMYPGFLYPPGDEGRKLEPDSLDIWWRLAVGGGHIVDAAHINLPELMGVPYHPLAFGQYINHPPAEVHPNVVKFTLVINNDFPRHLLPLIPVRWHSNPRLALMVATPRPALLFTVIYVAARHIHNEELFAEVRIRPGTYPDWYTPYREERNFRSYGMAPQWNDSRDVTKFHDGQSVGSR